MTEVISSLALSFLIDGFIRKPGNKCAARRINTELGAVAIIVDAKDDSARQFYEHHQFIPFADNQNQLFLPASTFAEYLAQD